MWSLTTIRLSGDAEGGGNATAEMAGFDLSVHGKVVVDLEKSTKGRGFEKKRFDKQSARYGCITLEMKSNACK